MSGNTVTSVLNVNIPSGTIGNIYCQSVVSGFDSLSSSEVKAVRAGKINVLMIFGNGFDNAKLLFLADYPVTVSVDKPTQLVNRGATFTILCTMTAIDPNQSLKWEKNGVTVTTGKSKNLHYRRAIIYCIF